MRQFSARKGFTLVELFLALAIILIVFAIVMPGGIEFYRSYALTSERDNLLGILRKARSLSMGNINEREHGVYVSVSDYTLFEGASYAARVAGFDQIYKRAAGLTTTGPNEIVFRQLDAYTTTSGTINISNGTGQSLIRVNNEGRIDW